MRTPRGRVVTNHAYRHFGLELPENADTNDNGGLV
jgi:Holliday junction DNA helicase RuvB